MESFSSSEVLEQARETLIEAEQSLQRIAARAVSQGEYESVVLVTEWASALKRMSRDASERVGRDSLEGKLPAATSSPNSRSPKPVRPKKYPQFFRDDQSLIKVGWSKSSKAEYEHRAPRGIVFSLVESICRIAGRSSLITMEKLLPLNESDGAEIPSYQLYLALAWLRDLGLVRQHGRQGYSVKSGIDLEKAATSAWGALPQRVKV